MGRAGRGAAIMLSRVSDAVSAHHRPGGGYRNPWAPEGAHRRIGALLKWLLIDRPRNRRPAVDRAAFAAAHPRVAPSFPSPRADPRAVLLTWVGHSSLLLQIGGQNLLIDPVWGERASPVSWAGPRRWMPPGIDFERLPPIDGVVTTHDHYDHLDRPTVRRLLAAAPAARWAAPLGVGAWLRRQGVADVTELDWWSSVEWAGLTLTATPAQHFSGRRPDNRNGTLWGGWAIRAGSGADRRAVYVVGDSAAFPEFSVVGARLGPFDAVCMPIGAYDPEGFMGTIHINPEEAVAAFRAIGSPGAVMAATHWGTFKLTDEPMTEPPLRAAAAWAAAHLDPGGLWIPRHGETRWIAGPHTSPETTGGLARASDLP